MLILMRLKPDSEDLHINRSASLIPQGATIGKNFKGKFHTKEFQEKN